MEEKQLQDMMDELTEEVDTIYMKLDSLSLSEYKKAQIAVRLLLFRKGVIDRFFPEETGMYNIVKDNFDAVDRLINFFGFRLRLDDRAGLLWVEPMPDEDCDFNPCTVTAMSANQLVLLCVLLKRLATDDSSQNVNSDSSGSLLLTEQDIISDMFPYMSDTDDEGKKRRDVLASINMFRKELGLLRLVKEARPNEDSGNVYRVSPYIAYRFNLDTVESIIKAVEEESREPEGTEDIQEEQDGQSI